MPFYPCMTPILERWAQAFFEQRMLRADWPAPARVHAFTTLRAPAEQADNPEAWLDLGMRPGNLADASLVGRDDLARHTALPSAPHWLHQVHGTQVAHFVLPPTRAQASASETLREDEPEADAAVTRTPGVVLAILTADCLPVLFCDDAGTEVAAAHAGWRGLAAGVLEATLAAMHAPRGSIIAWLGPAIAAPSYEVGEEVRAAFIAHDVAAAGAFTATRPGHWQCDLYTLARQRLAAAGVTRVFGGGLDTFTDARLHSYRRDGARSGRMASLITLLPAAA